MTTDPTPDFRQSDYLKRPDVLGHLKVLEVLRRWDPIGVADMSENEYESYAPDIIRMLDRQTRVEILEKYLLDLAYGHMGLSEVDHIHTRRCIDELIAFWHTWKGV